LTGYRVDLRELIDTVKRATESVPWHMVGYTAALVFYMNAMPFNLLAISTVVNAGLLLVKWWLGGKL